MASNSRGSATSFSRAACTSASAPAWRSAVPGPASLTATRALSRVAALFGPARVAGGGAAHDLERQQRALAASGGDLDAQLLDDPVGAQLGNLGHVHADQLLRADRRGGLGDRAALAVETQLGDLAFVDLDVHTELVAAERIDVVELQVVRLKLAVVPGVLVVLEYRS